MFHAAGGLGAAAAAGAEQGWRPPRRGATGGSGGGGGGPFLGPVSVSQAVRLGLPVPAVKLAVTQGLPEVQVGAPCATTRQTTAALS